MSPNSHPVYTETSTASCQNLIVLLVNMFNSTIVKGGLDRLWTRLRDGLLYIGYI